MKKIVILIFLLGTNVISAQKYITQKGKVAFEASVPLFEDVNAVDSNNVTVFDVSSGNIASVSNVKNFRFTVKLMEEHFNESYAETAKYPKTTFKGKIIGFKLSDLSSTPKKYTIDGTLNFHGVDRAVKSIATIEMKDGKINIVGAFKAKPADYKVTIPKMVTKKIAEEVNVSYNFNLTKQ